MIQKKDILKMAKHVFKRGRGIPDKRLLHPRRDWTIGLVLFVTVFVSGSVIAGQSFVKNQDIQIDTTVLSEQIPEYNKALVEKTLDDFGAKRDNFMQQNFVSAPVINDSIQATTTDEVTTDELQENNTERETDEELEPVVEEEEPQPIESSGSLLEAN